MYNINLFAIAFTMKHSHFEIDKGDNFRYNVAKILKNQFGANSKKINGNLIIYNLCHFLMKPMLRKNSWKNGTTRISCRRSYNI